MEKSVEPYPFCKVCPLALFCLSRKHHYIFMNSFNPVFHLDKLAVYNCVHCQSVSVTCVGDRPLHFSKEPLPDRCKLITNATICPRCEKEGKS